MTRRDAEYDPSGGFYAHAEPGSFDLFEHAPIAILSLDRNTCVLDCNLTTETLLGTRRRALIGKPLTTYVAAGEKGTFALHVASVLQGSTRRAVQVSFESPDGGATPFVGHAESVAVVDAMGQRRCLTALSHAARREREEAARAERSRREDALREEAKDARHRFDEIVAASFALTESLDLRDTASHAARMGLSGLLSYCAIDLVERDGGVRRAEVAFEDPTFRDIPLDPYAPHGAAVVAQTGSSHVLIEPTPADLLGLASSPSAALPLQRLVGSYMCLPLRAHGRTLGAITFVRPRYGAVYTHDDVAIAEELARRAALALDNARLHWELQDADRRKDEFLAMLGHELRNPLAAIVVAARSLLIRGANDSGVERLARVVDRQGRHLTRLVDDLLDVSRITRGKIELRKERIDLNGVVERAIETTRPLIDARRLELVVSLLPEPVLIDADPARIEQVVTNLLTNAAKFTGERGRVEIVSTLEDREAVLRVRDTGVGIAPEMIPRVFDLFTQVGPTLDRADQGLGLGLTLVRTLVEMHGGRVSAYSGGLGHGSELVVRLPALATNGASDVARRPAPARPANTNGARRRVLVVEDNPDLAEVMREQIVLWGHDVDVAHDGPEAIEAALARRYELLLIDIGLPGMSGYDVARRLRREPALAEAMLVALTGYGADADKRACGDAGFDLHLTKPVGEEALRCLLRGDGKSAARRGASAVR